MLQMIYALMGEDKFPPILDRQLDRFVHKLRDEVEDLIWEGRLRGYASAKPLFDSYQKLSDNARAKIFLSPEGFEAILRAVRNPTAESLETLVSVLNDYGEPGLTEAPDKAANIGVDEAGRERFMIGETVVVDIGGPWAKRLIPSSPICYSPFEPLTPFEAAIVERKLSAAFSEIEAAAPTFARLIRNYTRKILVRKIGDLPPASEQVDTELGAIRLRNVHADCYSHDQLVDDLIHESTHNFLGTFEYLDFPFIPYGEHPGPLVRPVSPWSMRQIQVLPFLHAVFVYFAMFNYAVKRLREPNLPPELSKRLQARRNRYASGFLMPGRLSVYVADLAKVDLRVLEAIEDMESVVQSALGANFLLETEEPRLALVA